MFTRHSVFTTIAWYALNFTNLTKMKRIIFICMSLTLSVSLPALAQNTDKEERNKNVIRQYQERINNRDAKGAVAYISDDMKNFGRAVGREGIQRVLDDISMM